MGKGYAEGPAAEEAEAARERGDHLAVDERPPPRRIVWGCTADEPESHVIGELGAVDPDELFASGSLVGMVRQGFLVLERPWTLRFQRFAELQGRRDTTTVALFLRPLHAAPK